jgi:predicted ABC-type transport system involved in lysophospholipase L1 biosynthesis ATPase subunit
MTIALAKAISNDVLNSVARDGEDVNVDAPPGSGKTHLLESCAALNSMHFGRITLVACNSNKQANELTQRMAIRFRAMNIQRLTASGVNSIPMLDGLPNVMVDDKPRGVRTVVTTADKLIESPSAPPPTCS